jgi:plasmid maintenance system antidote protein VapI
MLPGEILLEYFLDPIGWLPNDLAKAIDMPLHRLEDIIDGVPLSSADA